MIIKTGKRQSGKTHYAIEDIKNQLVKRVDKGIKTPLVVFVVKTPIGDSKEDLEQYSGKINTDISKGVYDSLFETIKPSRGEFGGITITPEMTKEDFITEIKKLGFIQFREKDLSIEEVTLSDLLYNDENTYYVIDDIFRYDNSPNVFLAYLEEDPFEKLNDPTISDLERKNLILQKDKAKMESDWNKVNTLSSELSNKIELIRKELESFIDAKEVYVEVGETDVNYTELTMMTNELRALIQAMTNLKYRMIMNEYKLKHISDPVNTDKITDKDTILVMKSMLDSIQSQTTKIESILLKESSKK